MNNPIQRLDTTKEAKCDTRIIYDSMRFFHSKKEYFGDDLPKTREEELEYFQFITKQVEKWYQDNEIEMPRPVGSHPEL